MDLNSLIAATSALIQLGTFVTNAIGADSKAAEFIKARIADGRTEWTDDEKALVEAELQSAKAYAKEQLAKPD